MKIGSPVLAAKGDRGLFARRALCYSTITMKAISIGILLFLALSLCGAESATLPSAANLLPRGAAFEPGRLFLLADTGHGAQPRLAPAGFAEAAFNGVGTAASSPKILRIEALAVLPAPRGASIAQNAAALGDTLRELALILGSVHGMEGLEYWSASRQRMRTLYAEAYRVESLSNRTKLPDPQGVQDSLPAFLGDFHAYLRDLTFGGNVFDYSIKVNSSSLSMTNANATTMSFLLIPLIPPRSIKTNIIIVPCEEGLLVHFLSTMEVIDIVAGRVFESAGNKSLAILGWFAQKTAAAGLTAELRLPKNIEEVERLK